MQAFIVVLLKNPNTGTIILCPHLTTPQGCNPFFMALSQGLGEWDGGGGGRVADPCSVPLQDSCNVLCKDLSCTKPWVKQRNWKIHAINKLSTQPFEVNHAYHYMVQIQDSIIKKIIKVIRCYIKKIMNVFHSCNNIISFVERFNVLFNSTSPHWIEFNPSTHEIIHTIALINIHYLYANEGCQTTLTSFIYISQWCMTQQDSTE